MFGIVSPKQLHQFQKDQLTTVLIHATQALLHPQPPSHTEGTQQT